ncbi:MAG: hypothetical protein AAB490_04445 [Patescibacteria group bacterium]
MKKNNVRIIFGILGLSVFLIMYGAAAQAGPGPITVYNPITAKNVPDLVNNMVRAILGIVGAVTLFMFVYGGLMWMTSGGASNRIERGRNTLVWATIGLLVIFSSYAILNFIFGALSGT